jgi:exonuclease III
MDFEDLIILSWNVRGALSAQGRRHLRDLVRQHHPLLIFLMETHCPFSRVAIFWNNLGYDICALSEATCHSGGIWVLKERGCTYDISIVDIYFQAVPICVKNTNILWFSAVYASPQMTNRQQLWNYLQDLRSNLTGPWLLMGDFNEVLMSCEIKGCTFPSNQADKFALMMERCELLDLGATGSNFTWLRKWGGGGCLQDG